MTLKHAKLSASGSARWLSCTGSVKAESTLPNTTTPYAMEGTAAHELADMCLSDGPQWNILMTAQNQTETNQPKSAIPDDMAMLRAAVDLTRDISTARSFPSMPRPGR